VEGPPRGSTKAVSVSALRNIIQAVLAKNDTEIFGECCGNPSVIVVALAVRARACGSLLHSYRCRFEQAWGSDSLRHASAPYSFCEARLDPNVYIALKPSDGTSADADGAGEGPVLDK
jgi:hypothetical protein